MRSRIQTAIFCFLVATNTLSDAEIMNDRRDQSRLKLTFTHPLYFIALGFGSGLSRYAPGTAGTLAAIPVFLLFEPLGLWVQLVIIVASFIGGVFVCDWVANDMSIKDPGCIVWDEFVGVWISLLLLPPGCWWILLAFLLFRFFDVLKPWPVSWLDRNLAGGLGIMADDVAAGIFALLSLQALHFAGVTLGLF